MSDYLGQTITVINTTGAIGSVGASEVYRAEHDGYTWFGGAAVHGTWPVLGHAEISWDNFYPLLAVVFPTTIYVRADAPWQTLGEMIADIEKDPTGHRFGHPGVGSNGEIFASLLAEAAGLEGIISIPYDGGREAATKLLAGEVDFISVTKGDASDMAVAGDLRPLANLHEREMEFGGVTFPSIADYYPDLVPHAAINPYMGLYIPRGVPEEVLIRITAAFEHAIEQDRFKDLLIGERGAIFAPITGQDADEMMARIESARSIPLYEVGVAPNNPADFGISSIEEFEWPPHERAEDARPWPAEIR